MSRSDQVSKNEVHIYNIIIFTSREFTCNMHSLGLPQDMCLDFLKKQSATASHTLSKGEYLKFVLKKKKYNSTLTNLCRENQTH